MGSRVATLIGCVSAEIDVAQFGSKPFQQGLNSGKTVLDTVDLLLTMIRSALDRRTIYGLRSDLLLVRNVNSLSLRLLSGSGCNTI
jgi:hypothetical protein